MSFLAGFILGGFVGTFLALVFLAAMTAAKRADEEAAQVDPSDPYGISERMARSERAYERAGITPMLGHPRIGIDTPKRGAARLSPPTP